MKSYKTNWTREISIPLSIHSGIDISVLERKLLKEMRKKIRKNKINKLFKN